MLQWQELAQSTTLTPTFQLCALHLHLHEVHLHLLEVHLHLLEVLHLDLEVLHLQSDCQEWQKMQVGMYRHPKIPGS